VPTITAILLPHLAEALRGIGADVGAILGRYHDRLDVQFEDRMPVADMIDIWERAVAVTGRRDLPVITLDYSIHDERSLISFSVANQPRYSDGIDRFARYMPTVCDAYCWRVHEDERELRVVASPVGPIHRAGWQCYLEYEAMDIVRSAERLTEGRAQPLALRFMHPAPEPAVTAAMTCAARVEPEFGCERAELVYSPAIRSLAISGARPALAAVVEARLEAMLDAIARNAPVTQRTRVAIDKLLAAGTADTGRLANAVGMSRRSLERALADEGTSAGALLEDERKRRAIAWLPSMSVEEVAARLGYSDARAFARAFKRWTGQPPSSARD
jgi:AraC-like DNA-binding protein